MDKIFSKYLSRNYHLALLVIGVSATGLFFHLVTGAQWVAIAGTVVGAFRAGDAVVDWIHRKHPDTKE